MGTRRISLFPIIVIVVGVLLQLLGMGIIGDDTTTELLNKLWPLLIAAVGLEFLLVQHRVLSGATLLICAVALFATQFLPGEFSTELWRYFVTFWPVLLIIYGIDCIISNLSLGNAAVLIVTALVVVYALLMTLDIPILKKIPIFNTQITASAPAPTQQNPNQNGSAGPIASSGSVAYALPSQASAEVNIIAASGRISLKAGEAGSNAYLAGSVKLDPVEQLYQQADLNSATAVYTLRSIARGETDQVSEWALTLSPQRTSAVDIEMTNGYVKTDLRGLNLSSVTINNAYGPVDVMVPVSSTAPVSITAGNGMVRVYIPSGGSVSVNVSGTENVSCPDSYTYANGTVSPKAAAGTTVSVTIVSNGGSVQIIES